jgi:hypothetical protein
MSGFIPLLPLYVFMALRGKPLPPIMGPTFGISPVHFQIDLDSVETNTVSYNAEYAVHYFKTRGF